MAKAPSGGPRSFRQSPPHKAASNSEKRPVADQISTLQIEEVGLNGEIATLTRLHNEARQSDPTTKRLLDEAVAKRKGIQSQISALQAEANNTPKSAKVVAEITPSRSVARISTPEALKDGPTPAEVMRFAEQTHADMEASLARIDNELAQIRTSLEKSPNSRLLEQLETLKLTKTLINESRHAQQELDEETRFLYEGVFAQFTSQHARDEKYQQRGTGGINLMLQAVRAARREVQQLQEREPDKTKRSKLIPRPIEEHQLKTVQNRVSQTLRAVLGPTSAVLDSGMVVGIFLSNMMARTGEVISYTDPVYAAAMLAGLGTVGVALENVKITAMTDDVVRSDKYLSAREKKGLGKQKMSWKQIRSLLAVTGYTIMQAEGVLVAVAGAQQGGDLNRETVEAAAKIDAQIEEVTLPEGFSTASFDDEEASKARYKKLNETGKFFVDLHRKATDIMDAEGGGKFIPGAGGTTHSGKGRNWGGKQALLFGQMSANEPDLMTSGPTGFAEGMKDRQAIAEEFKKRLLEVDLSIDGKKKTSEREELYHKIAEGLIKKHFAMNGTVLQEGVSLEQQVAAFYNDFIATVDEPAFIVLESTGQETGQTNIRTAVAEILEADGKPHGIKLTDEEREILKRVNEVGGEVISLRELYVLYKIGAIKTGAEVAVWSDDALDPVNAKISQSFGITPPNRATMRPHVMKIQDAVPLYEFMQNKLFAERSTLLLELVKSKFDNYKDPTAPAGTGITLKAPEASIDAAPFEKLNTSGGATWWSWETHAEAFGSWERAGMSTGVLALLLLLNFSPAYLTRLRSRKTQESQVAELDERRKQFEGDGDREKGSEYLLAEHISQHLNTLVSSTALNGMLPNVSFSPDMVQAAMREAAATDEIPVLANSPFTAPNTILGKTFSAMSQYPHLLEHMVVPVGIPEPPAIKAFNHLVTLYKDSTALTIRVAEQLLPGIGETLEIILQNADFVQQAALPPAEFKSMLQEATEEKKEFLSELRAKMLGRIHETAIGHHAFAKRYAQTKIDHLTNDAFDELYTELTEVGEEQRGKYLDLTKNPINLIEDNLDAFDSNNPGMLETMRESGLRQTIARELENELKEANRLIVLADQETARFEAEETLDVGLYGKGATRIIRDQQNKRRTKIAALGKYFTENSDPHIRQFSSTTAIRDQVFQDIRQRVLSIWYSSEEEQKRIQNWVGVPVKEQLKGIQEVARTQGIYLLDKLPLNRRNSIEAYGEGSPFEGVTTQVFIESRKRQRSRDAITTDASADEGVPQVQVDRHVVTYSFIDREGKQIFKIPVEIRNTLSKAREQEEISRQVSKWINIRREYFSARVLLDSIDETAHDAESRNEREIRDIQQRLGRIGFSIPQPKNGETYDFSTVDLSKRGSKEAVTIYLNELLPRLARRTQLKTILSKNDAHQRNIERNLTPNYMAGKFSNGKLLEQTASRLSMLSRLWVDLRGELRKSVETDQGVQEGTLEERVQKELVRDMESVVAYVADAERDLRRSGIKLSFSPRSPEFVTVTHAKRLLGPAERTERVKVSDILTFTKRERPSSASFANFLKNAKTNQ